MSKVKASILAIIAILSPIEAILATVFTLVLVDLLSGIVCAYKQRAKINSQGIKKTVLKLLVYELAIVLAYFVGLYLTGDSVPVLKMVSTVIGITELTSIYENLNIIAGGSLLNGIINSINGGKPPDPPSV